MQFQVPQFIETEDKIVGPFSVRQFLYVAGAGAVSFVFYFTVQTWLWIVASLFLFGIAVTLAFVRVNGRPMIHVFGAALRFLWQPQTYVWQPENPRLPKSEATLRPLAAPGFSLENVLSGLALRNVWQKLQASTKTPPKPGRAKERFEVFRRMTGERKAARRVDYR